jgi:hypothetical protein
LPLGSHEGKDQSRGERVANHYCLFLYRNLDACAAFA